MGRVSPQKYKELPQIGVVVVLDNIRSAHNVGSAFRTCDSFKIDKLWLCGICAVPPSAEIHKSALGAEDSVPWEHSDSTLDVVARLRADGYTVVSVEQTVDSVSLETFSPELSGGKKYALVFGNEVDGVDQSVVDASDFTLEIRSSAPSTRSTSPSPSGSSSGISRSRVWGGSGAPSGSGGDCPPRKKALYLSMNMTGQATVVKNAGSHFLLSRLPEWQPFPAVLKGKVRLKGSEATNPVAVGDRVTYEYSEDPSAACPASIVEVLDRRNYVIRRSTNLSRQSHVIAANLDRVFIVVTLFFPEIKLPFLDRLLVTCEVYGIPATIVLNKVDIFRKEFPEQLADFHRIYESAGYRVIETSALTGEGIDELRAAIGSPEDGRVCLFSGESGVGKSSIIKALDPSLNPKVGDISLAHLQGRHTTSLYEMYPLSSGGFIIDSPGLRGFGLVRLEKEEIALYFPEMLRYSRACRFAPCTHTHEPGCAVKQAVEDGFISAERYNSYLGMLEEDKKFR